MRCVSAVLQWDELVCVFLSIQHIRHLWSLLPVCERRQPAGRDTGGALPWHHLRSPGTPRSPSHDENNVNVPPAATHRRAGMHINTHRHTHTVLWGATEEVWQDYFPRNVALKYISYHSYLGCCVQVDAGCIQYIAVLLIHLNQWRVSCSVLKTVSVVSQYNALVALSSW